MSYFNRNTTIPNYQFEGTQTATFTEANYTNSTEKSEWVAGVNIWTDNFKEKADYCISVEGLQRKHIRSFRSKFF